MINIEATNLTQAKRKASLNFNKTYTVIQEFMYKGLKFSRVNKKCPNGDFKFSKWN